MFPALNHDALSRREDANSLLSFGRDLGAVLEPAAEVDVINKADTDHLEAEKKQAEETFSDHQ